MTRFLAVVLLALIGFYAAWPAFTVYRLKAALEAQDTAGVAATVDFERVRETLRPAVKAEIAKRLAAAIGGNGTAAPGPLTDQLAAMTVKTVLQTFVTPESAVRLYRDRANLKKALSGAIARTSGESGGDAASRLGQLFRRTGGSAAGQEPATGTASEDAAPPAPAIAAKGLSLANVKSFAVSGPTSYTIGLARDQQSTAPDVLVELAFAGIAWKVVGVTVIGLGS